MKLATATAVLYASIVLGTGAMLLNASSFVRHVIDIPDHPVSAMLWATWMWVMVLVGLWSVDALRQSLWLRQARLAGPPRAWRLRGDQCDELMVRNFGIDNEGAPAWRVDGELEIDDGIVVEGLTRHAVIYIPVEYLGVARLKADG